MEEDLILLEKSLVLGTKWAKILKFLEGRNQHQIKNRFTALVSDINQVSKEKIRDLIKTNKVENLAQKTLDYLKQYQNLLETGKKREEEIKKKFEMSGIFLKE